MAKSRTARSPKPESSPPATAAARYKVEAVARAANVLEVLRRGPGAMTLDAISARVGIQPAALEMLLATLEKRGLVRSRADATGSYSLGLAWLRLADVKRRQLELREVALPVMRRVRDTIGETVSLGIRIGASRVNIEYAESRHEVRRITQPGFHVPLHQGAGGRTILSGLDDARIEAYLAGVGLSQVQKAKLLAGIKAARRDGYAVVDSEVAADTAAVSAPIRDHLGDVVAVTTISLPTERLTPQMRARSIREVTKAARDISLALGFDPARRTHRASTA